MSENNNPSGPSQDSQEVRGAAQHLIFIQDRLDEMTGLKREELNHVTIADLLSEKDKAIKAVRAALSQSPKGAAGATMGVTEYRYAMALRRISNGNDTATMREWALDALGEGGEPSAPKTGLRGAPRLICFHCRTNPATCIGKYEEASDYEPACDACCGHGNEDGYCCPVGDTLSLLSTVNAEIVNLENEIKVIEDERKAELESQAAQPPLSAAKGPDLPPSSQPAPGDVGSAGGVA